MRNLFTPSLSALVSLFIAFGAWADEVTLSALKDNTLYQEAGGLLSNGMGDYFFAGRTLQGVGFDHRRGLLAFNLSAIPAGSVITSVQLTLECSQTNLPARPYNVSLHRALANWGEGASNAAGGEGQGAPSAPNDATWIHTFYSNQFWTNAGGDFSATPSATVSVVNIGPYTWGTTAAMVADVQHWVDNPMQNFGWVIRGNESVAGSAKRFNSVQNPLTSQRPRLVVNFDPPAALIDVVTIVGTTISGNAASLRNSDNQYYVVQSGPGLSSEEPTLMEFRAGFLPSTAGPTMRLTFEGMLDHPNGIVRIRVRNWATGMFDEVDQFVLGTTESVRVINGVSTTDRIRFGDQRIEISVRQTVLITFSSNGFRSSTDLLRTVIVP